jgi:hypothetical protein
VFFGLEDDTAQKIAQSSSSLSSSSTLSRLRNFECRLRRTLYNVAKRASTFASASMFAIFEYSSG